jgi:hypothetical protein
MLAAKRFGNRIGSKGSIPVIGYPAERMLVDVDHKDNFWALATVFVGEFDARSFDNIENNCVEFIPLASLGGGYDPVAKARRIFMLPDAASPYVAGTHRRYAIIVAMNYNGHVNDFWVLPGNESASFLKDYANSGGLVWLDSLNSQTIEVLSGRIRALRNPMLEPPDIVARRAAQFWDAKANADEPKKPLHCSGSERSFWEKSSLVVGQIADDFLDEREMTLTFKPLLILAGKCDATAQSQVRVLLTGSAAKCKDDARGKHYAIFWLVRNGREYYYIPSDESTAKFLEGYATTGGIAWLEKFDLGIVEDISDRLRTLRAKSERVDTDQ